MDHEDDYRKQAIWNVDQYDFPVRISLAQVKKRAKWYRAQLAAHRKAKSTWHGTELEYEGELGRLIERVQHYRTLRSRPDYVAEMRKTRNTKRRRKRIVRLKNLDNTLNWLVLRVKRKRYKTLGQLARSLKKPISFVAYIKKRAIASHLMTEEQWRSSFRQPGRPRKGKPRGKYNTRRDKVNDGEIRLSA